MLDIVHHGSSMLAVARPALPVVQKCTCSSTVAATVPTESAFYDWHSGNQATRNTLVHEYVGIDYDRHYEQLVNDPDDLSAFARTERNTFAIGFQEVDVAPSAPHPLSCQVPCRRTATAASGRGVSGRLKETSERRLKGYQLD